MARILLVVLLLAAVACRGDAGDGIERVAADLHPCAAGFPVPEGMMVLETASRRASAEQRQTCVVVLGSPAPVPEATTALADGMRAAGLVAHIDRRDQAQGFVRIEGDHCAIAAVVPAATALDPEDRTDTDTSSAALVSLIPCELVPDAPPG